MMKRALIVGLALLAASCAGPFRAKPRPEAPAGGPELQPLDAGRRWEYVGLNGERHVHRVAGTERLGRLDCVVFERVSGQDVQRLWMRNDASGLRHYRFQDGELAPRDLDDPAIHIAYPAQKGAAWSYSAVFGPVLLKYDVVVDAVQTIEVPAGRFHCVKVRTLGKADGATMVERSAWYAPGVGLVMEESTLNLGAGDIKGRLALTAYSPR